MVTDGAAVTLLFIFVVVFRFLFVSGSSPFHQKARRLRAASGGCLQEEPLVPAPAPKLRGEGRRDWNKNEHDNPNNSRPGESRERKAESRNGASFVVILTAREFAVCRYGG
jgi:hypothetical protein